MFLHIYLINMADRRLYILLSTFPGSRCCIPSLFWHSCFTACQVGYCFPIKRIGWVFLEGQLKTSWTIVLCKVGEKQSINIISVEVLLIEESKQWYHDDDVNNNVSFFQRRSFTSRTFYDCFSHHLHLLPCFPPQNMQLRIETSSLCLWATPNVTPNVTRIA